MLLLLIINTSYAQTEGPAGFCKISPALIVKRSFRYHSQPIGFSFRQQVACVWKNSKNGVILQRCPVRKRSQQVLRYTDPLTVYCTDNPENLTYSVFWPDSLNGNKITCPLVCIVLLHGGSFYECSSQDNHGILSCHMNWPKEVLLCSIRNTGTGVLEDPRIAPSGYNYLSAQQAPRHIPRLAGCKRPVAYHHLPAAGK